MFIIIFDHINYEKSRDDCDRSRTNKSLPSLVSVHLSLGEDQIPEPI